MENCRPEGTHACPCAHLFLDGGRLAREGDALFALGGVLGAQSLGAEDVGYGDGGDFIVFFVVGAAREASGGVGEGAHDGGDWEVEFERGGGRHAFDWRWWWVCRRVMNVWICLILLIYG